MLIYSIVQPYSQLDRLQVLTCVNLLIKGLDNIYPFLTMYSEPLSIAAFTWPERN